MTAVDSSSPIPNPSCLSHQHLECEHLRAGLASRYDVVGVDVHIGVCSFDMLRVRDTNVLLEGLDAGAFTLDERLPYWAEVWPASIELARYCLEESSLQGKSVIELGCGLGLAGVAAARAGAHVLFTDYEADALQFARHNALKNLAAHGAFSCATFRILDWRSQETPGQVDLILGADIVYERRNFLPILQFVRRTLKVDGRAIFTDPDRSTVMSFFALAEQQGFHVSIEARRLEEGRTDSTILLGELRPAGRPQ